MMLLLFNFLEILTEDVVLRLLGVVKLESLWETDTSLASDEDETSHMVEASVLSSSSIVRSITPSNLIFLDAMLLIRSVCVSLLVALKSVLHTNLSERFNSM